MTQEPKPINFLIVDDLEENLLSLEALLKRDGLTFLKARSGEEALEILLVNEVALALLDVQMPGMDGFQLAEFMRGNERARHIPIIFLTAGTTDAQRRFRGYEAGAVDFIQKPIEPDILRSKVNVFFDLYRQRQLIQTQRDELKIYSEALKTADRHKSQFIAMLGHELRNPLMALMGGLRLLERSNDAERAQDIRGKMQTQVHNLSRLVEDLLDISRIGQGKISLRKETVDLTGVLTVAVETSLAHIEASNHTLSLDLPKEPAWVNADPTRLTQVVSNLLTNAAKYTPPGGRIELYAQQSGAEIEIVVSDNGVGIPEEMQTRIFDIFAQLPAQRESPQDGLGIGLALVKQLVELHDGTIAVESEGQNCGSRFIVRLPSAEAPAGQGRAPAKKTRARVATPAASA